MKKLYVLLLAAGLMFTTEAQSQKGFGQSDQDNVQKRENFQKNKKLKKAKKVKTFTGRSTDGQVDPVGAPLDGGLLVILAAAGGAYFVARKKKRNQQ